MILAGNWKMNLSPASAENLMKKLKEYNLKKHDHTMVLLIPSYYFLMASQIFQNTSIKWGGQNCFSKNQGSFTGEISPQVMNEMGATYCLVGHSERREKFHESPQLIEEKFHAIVENNMTPILCVGETLKQRKDNQIESILKEQLEPYKNLSNFILAYEPLWAIGASEAASTPQITEAIDIILQILQNKIPILYGGSVHPDSAKTFSFISHLNGFLVGRSSLDFSQFTSIYENYINKQT